MIILSYLKWGFGSKIFMLMYSIAEFKRISAEKLYVVQEDSHHDTGHPSESFLHIFPKLKKYKWLSFISWKEYDNLRKSKNIEYIQLDMNINMMPSWMTNEHILKYGKLLLPMNSEYKELLKKYDTKNDVAIHIRYGDKFEINKERKKKGLKPMYILLTPEYYIYHCQKFLAKKKRNVIIFTDSPELVSKYILPRIPNGKIADEPYPHVFYLLTQFRRQIISDSTLSLAAGYLNKFKHQIVAPDMVINLKTFKIQKHFFHNDDVFEKETNKKFIVF